MRNNDTLLSCVRVNLRRRLFISRDTTDVASTAFSVLSPKDDVDPRFLFHWVGLDAFVNRLIALQRGNQPPAVTDDDIRDQLIPMPPLELQQQISARIDGLFTELDDGEAALARARADLGTWRKALLKAAVTGELTADWREANAPAETGADLLARILNERRGRWVTNTKNIGRDYNNPTDLKNTDLPKLPCGWAWASLSQLSSEEPRSFQSGPFGSALLHSEFQNDGMLVIGIDNVKEGYFSLGSNHRITQKKYRELSRFQARSDDVLVTVMATIGRTCVVPKDIEDSIISKHVYRISPDPNSVMPHFLMNCLRANPATIRYLFGKAQGQTRPGLNKKILENTPIPLPSLEEQRLCLNTINDSLLPTQKLMDEVGSDVAQAIRQSILAAAFRGDLVA